MFMAPGSSTEPPNTITEGRPGLPAILVVQRVLAACAEAGIAKSSDTYLAALSCGPPFPES
jgi:hypothetical protein